MYPTMMNISNVAFMLIKFGIYDVILRTPFLFLIDPFKISPDNYNAVDASALCVYKTASVVGSRRVTRMRRQHNSPHVLGRAHS